MNGVINYGTNMLKKISVIASALSLCHCSMMPGMDNINTRKMQKYTAPKFEDVHATLIPISADLIADQRINTYYYHVAPSDVLHITVWQHPEFLIEVQGSAITTSSTQGPSGQQGYLVNANGDIFFPLIGYVKVANKTVDTIRAEITHKLRKYVPNPQVNVRVADFRGQKIYVLGELNKVGFLPITDQQLTIADALAQSGWMNVDTADPSYIYVIRGSFTAPQIYWLNAKTADKLLLAERFSLQPRDILYVSTAPVTRWNRLINQLLPSVQPIIYSQAFLASA